MTTTPAAPPPRPCFNPDCPEVIQDPPILTGRRKKFHSIECGRTYWDKQKRADHPSTRHSISEIDEAAHTGTCSICGPGVSIYRISDKYEDGRKRLRWKCKKRVQMGAAESRKRFDQSRKGRQAAMRSRYGLTREQLAEAEALDTGACHICGATDKPLVYEHDHDHETKRHRGWTCHACNLLLGNARNDPEILRAAIAYLERAY